MSHRGMLYRRQWASGRLGYTLIELMLVMSVVMIISMIAVPQYMDAVSKARIAKAIGDIAVIGREIQLFFVEEARYPDGLADVGFGQYTDPYGNPYEYLNIGDQDLGGLGLVPKIGMMRVDRFQIPINSDFDLYSRGEDGATLPLLIALESLDDIVRAADGGYIGLASEY